MNYPWYKIPLRPIDCGVLKEMNITKGFFARESSGFRVMATEVLSSHRGGVASFYREAENFSIEELRLHGPNIIGFQLVTWRRRWHVMGCYIAPNNALTIEDVAAAIRDRPYGAELLVTGNLNSNLAELEGTSRCEAITDKLAMTGLLDMGLHFLPRCKPWLQDMCMWHMRRDGQEVRSRTD